MHPIFHAAACGDTRRALQALDCDVDALVSALDHLMVQGSVPHAQVLSQQHVAVDYIAAYQLLYGQKSCLPTKPRHHLTLYLTVYESLVAS